MKPIDIISHIRLSIENPIQVYFHLKTKKFVCKNPVKCLYTNKEIDLGVVIPFETSSQNGWLYYSYKTFMEYKSVIERFFIQEFKQCSYSKCLFFDFGENNKLFQLRLPKLVELSSKSVDEIHKHDPSVKIVDKTIYSGKSLEQQHSIMIEKDEKVGLLEKLEHKK